MHEISRVALLAAGKSIVFVTRFASSSKNTVILLFFDPSNQSSSVAKHKLNPQEKLLCKKIGPKLVKDGLYFVGIDVIGGKLVEVNVMSPGGITYMNKVYKIKLQEKVVDFLESKVLERNAAFMRKTDLRKIVDEA